MPHYPSEIEYSDKYYDDYYEYRHVVLPKDTFKKIGSKNKLLSEQEWRALGVQQSRGWVHYEIHKPEPHILLFRRAKGSDPITGQPPANFVPPPDHFWCLNILTLESITSILPKLASNSNSATFRFIWKNKINLQLSLIVIEYLLLG